MARSEVGIILLFIFALCLLFREPGTTYSLEAYNREITPEIGLPYNQRPSCSSGLSESTLCSNSATKSGVLPDSSDGI